MKMTHKEISKNSIFIVLILILGFVVISSYITLSAFRDVKAASASYANLYLEENKLFIKSEVKKRIAEIQSERDAILRFEMNAVQHEILHMVHIMGMDQGLDIEDLGERRLAAVDSFKKITSFDDDYLYLALTTDGKVLSTSEFDTIENIHLFDMDEETEIDYDTEIKRIVDNPEGIFMDYKWPLEDGGAPEKLITFAYYMPTVDMIVAAGIYESELDNRIQNRIYEKLQTYYENDDNYLFIIGYDGSAKVTSASELVGKDFSTVMNTDGEAVHSMIMETIGNPEREFLTYHYYKKGENKISEKTSYAVPYDDWGVYIGMGFHTNDLNMVIEEYNRTLKSQYALQMIIMGIGMLVLALVVLVYIQRGLTMQKTYLEQEGAILTKLFHVSDDGIIVLDYDGNLKYENRAIRKIMPGFNRFIADGVLNLPKVDDTTYMLENDSGRFYYLKMSVYNAAYRGKDSLIHFIKDVTETYLKENKQEQSTLVDPLTWLRNKKALANYFEDKCYDHLNNDQLLLGIVDIDHMNEINDNYGFDKGDEVIKLLAEAFVHRLREHDRVFRYSGEQFVVVLEYVPLESGRSILEDVNNQFNALCKKRLDMNVTFSGGMIDIDWTADDCSLRSIIMKADNLLYDAKVNGRNRIEI